MKSMRSKNLFFVALVASFFLVCAPVVNFSYAADPVSSEDESDLVEAARTMRASGRVHFNFSGLDIVKFVRFMSELLNENIIIAPDVKGTVSVMSPKPISLAQSRQIMIATLEMNGFAIQSLGEYSKVVPLKDGPSRNVSVTRTSNAPGFIEEHVSQVVPLDYVTPDFIQKAVAQVVGNKVAAMPLERGSGLLLTGRGSDVSLIVSLVRALDVPESVRLVKSVKLEYADPKVVAGHLTALAADQLGPLRGLVVTADDVSKKVVLVGEKKVLDQASKIVANVDVVPASGEFHVYRLEHADATLVSEQLSKVLAAASAIAATGEKGSGLPTTVVPDVPSNSLVFVASDYHYNSLVRVIKQLDVQPRQVLLRGLIAEVNLTKLDSAGVDWATWGGAVMGDAVLAANADIGGSGGVPSTFVSWFQQLSQRQEVQYDSNGNAVTTTNYSGSALIYSNIQLLKTHDAINVLSMPRLMCTDNMESSMQVGQVIPQLKSSTSDISSPSATQNSYDYKDTGLILKVTPHIRSGNLIALDIEQSTEEVLTAMTSTTPTTAKREIKTTVQVNNGDTVILGGMLKETDKHTSQRVPILSYIPIVGELFKKSSKQKEKVELLIFLTPYIQETPAQAAQTTREFAMSDGRGLSPEESEVDKRLREMYKQATKKR